MERPQILGERAWLRQRLECAVETELMPSEQVLQLIDELTPKDFAERLDRQEEAVLGMDPTGPVGSEAAFRHDVMDMRMMFERLSPGPRGRDLRRQLSRSDGSARR